MIRDEYSYLGAVEIELDGESESEARSSALELFNDHLDEDQDAATADDVSSVKVIA
jgi:hypothetical protein